MVVPGGNIEPSHSHGHSVRTTQPSPIEETTWHYITLHFDSSALYSYRFVTQYNVNFGLRAAREENEALKSKGKNINSKWSVFIWAFLVLMTTQSNLQFWHSPIHSVSITHESYTASTAIRGNFGFRILPKATLAQRMGETGIDPPTFWPRKCVCIFIFFP